MAKKNQVRKLKFGGRLISSLFDFQSVASDVLGLHHVIYPKSISDVATAVSLSRKLKTFIRSGTNVSKQDMVDGSGGVVINMKEMSSVTVKGKSLKAQAAATSEGIAQRLAQHQLALPLTDNPFKSIASDVLFETPSYLMRSLGPLSDYVSKIRAVRPDGSRVTMKDSATASCLQKCRDANAVIAEVEFKPASAKDLWMYRATFPYPGRKKFSEIAQLLFLKTKFTKLLNKTDVAIDAFSGPYNIPLVRISALGASPSGRIKLRTVLKKAVKLLPKSFETEDIVFESFTGPEMMDALAESGMGASPDALVDSTRVRDSVDAGGEMGNFLEAISHTIDRGFSFEKSADWDNAEKPWISTCVRLNREDGLEVSGYNHTPRMDEPLSVSMRATPLHPGVEMPVPSALAPLASSGLIPNFKGDIYSRNDWGYRSRAKQYATSSYPASGMTPYLVAYPRDERDIIAAVSFAKANLKKVVARSGGHQYSGKSSGGQNTIVLSMDHFDQLTRQNDGTVRVGPAVRLANLASRFRAERVTIPHGECPKVAIGGHAQTGGYGHLIRSFGLCLDYVSAFDIVLADGRRRTVKRPQPGTSTTTENDELFWGVLGGNAGSFGIVTSYDFDCVRDRDHPNSYGFTMRRRYRESTFAKLMKETQKWTKQIEGGTLDSDLDFMMTVASSRAVLPFPALLVELVHSNLGGAGQPVDGEQIFKPIIKAAKHKAGLWNLFTTSGRESLSSLSQSFVRTWPAVTADGREFPYPYRKRVNCTISRLSNEFVEEFVRKISHVALNESRVKLVFQMVFGGGALRNSPRRPATSIPQRDSVYCLIFDLFYKDGGQQIAEGLQRDMQQLIDLHFSDGQERRVFWGSFGDTDISNPPVRRMYYDSDDQYSRLQRLKQNVDPDDMFHTSLTVQLPDV